MSFFQNDDINKKSSMEITDLTENAVRGMLWWMYTAKVEDLEEGAIELLPGAMKYQLKG